MRIVIDFQAAQTGSRFRGIGRYATDLVKAIISEGTKHEFFLVLNGLFAETIEPIRAEFDSLLPQDQIRVWYAPGHPEDFACETGSMREAAQIIREYFIRTIDPDVVLLTSLFEGLGDPSVVTVKEYVKDVPTAAIFYDFTPLLLPDEHFSKSPMHRRWYRHRIGQLRRCDMLFAISESSRKEVIKEIDFPESDVVNVLGGISEGYERQDLGEVARSLLLRRYGITKPFILYTGGVERNKNLSTLVEALSHLGPEVKRDYLLVVVGKRNPGEPEKIHAMALDSESQSMIHVVGFVPQDDLVGLYNAADAFVFPSLREGLGMPPLEAMACGAPTIVANATSLPEVVSNPEALFDPTSPKEIASKISAVLSDGGFKSRLVERGLARASEVTWQASANKVLTALEARYNVRKPLDTSRRTIVTHTSQFEPRPLRILAMKLDHNGDFLLSLPAMAKLRARYPDARIDAVVGSWNVMAAEASQLFDHVYTLDFYKGHSAVRPSLDDGAMEQLLDEMPYYDFAIDIRRQPDTRFILIQFKADKYFGYRCNDEAIDRLLTDPLDVHPDDRSIRSYFDETHTCEQMLRIVDSLPFGMRDYIRLPDLGTRQPVRPGSVAIFPRVGLDARQWDSTYFAALIDRLGQTPEVSEINIYVGRPDDLRTIPYAPSDRVRVHTGLKFPDLFSSLSANQVCVGNNSFGVHLGGYAGCRTIAIYSGHELPQQWGPPFGDSLAITVDASCAPCHLPDRNSCPFDLMCLNDISVDTVKSAVLDALAGNPIPENYSRIRGANPATAVKPLVDAINKSKFLGRVDALSPEQKVALGAAVSINFPARASSQRCIFIDVSGMLSPDAVARSSRRLRNVQRTIQTLRDRTDGIVVPIASAQHDHEFYSVEVENLEESLHSSSRNERIVRPIAGDIYVGLHAYPNRNPAQWNLLTTWRQMGVFTVFNAPDALDIRTLESDDDRGRALSSYLFTIAHFDAIVVERNCAELREWIREFGPPRLREIRCGDDLLDLIPRTGEQPSVRRSARQPEKRRPTPILASRRSEVRSFDTDRDALAKRKMV
jgi:glycosyltransferase involved in cell wall biosynthesis/ADP-heptose:LPS heptosyltransferase